MAIDREVLERLMRLETEYGHLQEEVNDLRLKVGYYDKMALKWGGFIMGVMTLAALIAAGVDKVKEKIVGWFLP